MREFCFRGKRKDNGEWIESRSIRQFGDNEIGLLVGWVWAEIVPETLGQYTGLADKNGKKIFEGDIVRFDYAEPDVDGTTKSSPRVVLWDTENAGFCVNNEVEYETLWGLDWYVIGNIYDNPELIGGFNEDRQS